MVERLDDLRQEFFGQLHEVVEEKALEQLRVQFLGKKGALTGILKGISSLPVEERRQTGQQANQLKQQLEQLLEAKRTDLQQARFRQIGEEEKVDLSKPVNHNDFGHLHPLQQTIEYIEHIFYSIGFTVADGPEVEYDKYCFEMLNMPPHHPARDTQDTFYFSPEILLRTQTSSMQIRYMLDHQPPVRIIAPGKVYRRDYDLTHTPMFHQFEGLVVGEDITIGDLKGTAEYALKQLLGEGTKLRFRPHFFPYTEPSLEIDVSCAICAGAGCRTCKFTGWLEMAGAGMVHPQVLRNVGYDPDEVSGFAFGFGIDRIVMMRHGISDLRMMFENDLRFLQQF